MNPAPSQQLYCVSWTSLTFFFLSLRATLVVPTLALEWCVGVATLEGGLEGVELRKRPEGASVLYERHPELYTMLL